MHQTLFYVLGVTLVVTALLVSAVGLKFESFPPSRAVMLGVIGVFVALVGGTTTFAVLNAQDEQKKTEAERAASSTESTSTPATSTAGSTTTGSTTSSSSTSSNTTSSSSTTTAAGPGGTVNISADPSGQLAFQEKTVTSKPGPVKIDFTNQTPVGHDVKIADSKGDLLGGTDLVTGGTGTATVDLPKGTYTFYCDVPGHEQAGMKGTLTVK
jgi:plastocyanin